MCTRPHLKRFLKKLHKADTWLNEFLGQLGCTKVAGPWARQVFRSMICLHRPPNGSSGVATELDAHWLLLATAYKKWKYMNMH